MRHVIVGKGPIGTTLAYELRDRGEEVVVLSRTGGVGQLPGRPAPDVEAGAIDATDGDALAVAAAGADVLYECVNVPYPRWLAMYPPLHAAILTAAARSGAVLVTAANLYGYGQGSGVMREDTPLRSTDPKGALRARLWAQTKRRHDAGDLRAVEVRGSDYVGPGAGPNSHAGERLLAPLLAGKPVRPVGAADQPHSWTYLPDFARALAAAARTDVALGSAWLVPDAGPLTIRELANRLADAAGVARPKVAPFPVAMLRALGVVAPMLREIARESYQFTEPFVVDATRSAQVLGVAATPWDEVIAATVAAARG